MNHQKMLENIMLWMLICTGMYLIMSGIYSLGFYNGFYLKRDTTRVKKDIIVEGNLIKYPFGKEKNTTQGNEEGSPPAA